MKDRALLAAWLAAVVAVTFVHDPRGLAAGIVAVAVASGRRFPRLARRAALAVLLFNSVVSVSYLAWSWAGGTFPVETVLRLNARTFLITYLTFWAVAAIDPLRALGFSRTLVTVLTIAWAQVRGFRRAADDFRLALESRSVTRVSVRDRLRHAAATGAHLLHRSLHEATEITLALRSRGLFS